MSPTCPVCASKDVRIFFELPSMPIHNNLLWPSREEAVNAPYGEICLGFCKVCSHVFNTRYDPGRMSYSQQYENALDFSPRFNEYIRSLASDLVSRYRLYGKDLLEIGCGKGEFLRLLCESGKNRGVGFDPAAPGNTNDSVHSIQFIQDTYSSKYTHYPADLVCSRQTLEHIERPREFLSMLRQAIGSRSGTIVFFEVPNVFFILRELSIWDIIYEHPSYYSRRSLAYLFQTCGFRILSVNEVYGGQFLTLEGKPGDVQTSPPVGEDGDLIQDVDAFVNNFDQKITRWQKSIEQLAEARKKTVVWGAGSKGVSFLNLLKPGQQIPYVVDINPRKIGMFVAGSGQKIVPPQFLQEIRPDVVIVMNNLYKDEIRQEVERLGLQVEFYYP